AVWGVCHGSSQGAVLRPAAGSRVPAAGGVLTAGTGCASAVDVRGQGRDEGHVPVALRVVESVADHELVGHVEAHVLHVDVDLRGLRLPQHRADLDGGRAAGLEVGEQPRQGQAGVDDVLDDEDVLVLQVRIEVLEDPHDTGGLRAGAVGGHRHPVHADLRVECAGQVRHHHDGALEDAHQQEV